MIGEPKDDIPSRQQRMHLATSLAEFDPTLLTAANVNPATGLATDYLNHYNEVVMLLELMPSMPESVADILAWTPLSYEDHFRRSNYRGKDLVLTAYGRVSPALRRQFGLTIAEMDAILLALVSMLRGLDDPALAGSLAEEASARLKPLIGRAAGLVNGTKDWQAGEESAAQAQIDALLAQ